MDNGNKIRINRPEVKLFLHNDLLPSNIEAPTKYNLTEEYAKTRSKKVSFAATVLVLCIIIVAALMFGLVSFLQERNDTLEVDIEVFNDLNLKNLLDVVSRTQASLDNASQQKNQLELELSTKLAQAKLKRDSETQLLNSLNLDDLEKINERNAINREYENSVASLNAEYQPQIAVLEGQMEDYTAQLASFDSTNVELAQEQEAAINSQRQAFELEKQALIENYDTLVADLVAELEALQAQQLETQAQALSVLSSQHEEELNVFDPVFYDEKANSVVRAYLSSPGRAEENVEVESYSFSSRNYSLPLKDDATRTSFETMLLDINNEYADFNYVADIASTVPWANSLNEYIDALANMANKIGDDIISSSVDIFIAQDVALEESKRVLEEKEQEVMSALAQNEATLVERDGLQLKLDALQSEFNVVQDKVLEYENLMHGYAEREVEYAQMVSSLDARARQNGDAGYILNVANDERISVYISPLFIDSVQEGTRAFVFRSGNLVGMVSLHRNEETFYAKADEGIAELLRANDVLLLELIQ